MLLIKLGVTSESKQGGDVHAKQSHDKQYAQHNCWEQDKANVLQEGQLTVTVKS